MFKQGDWVMPTRNNPNNDVGLITGQSELYYELKSFIAGLDYGNISVEKEKAHKALTVINKEVADILIALQPQ